MILCRERKKERRTISKKTCDNLAFVHKKRQISLTFAVSLIHDLQVGVSHAAGHQQSALIFV